MLVLTNCLWGISFPVMKMTNLVMRGPAQEAGTSGEGVDQAWHYAESASFLVCVRFSLGLAMFAVLYPRVLAGMTRLEWGWGLLTGLGFSGGMILQNMALNDISASRSGFLTSLTVVFTPLFMLAIHRQVPRGTLIIGAACALIGTAVLTGLVTVGGGGVSLAPEWRTRLGWGDLTTILAAALFAVQIILVDRASVRMSSSRLTPGMFLSTLLVGCTALGISHAYCDAHHVAADWPSWLGDVRFLVLALILSIVCTIVAFHWMNTYQPYVKPAEAAVVYSLEPLFATMWAMCLPGLFSPWLGLEYRNERPGWEFMLGGMFLIVGNLLALWPSRVSGKPRAAENLIPQE